MTRDHSVKTAEWEKKEKAYEKFNEEMLEEVCIVSITYHCPYTLFLTLIYLFFASELGFKKGNRQSKKAGRRSNF